MANDKPGRQSKQRQQRGKQVSLCAHSRSFAKRNAEASPLNQEVSRIIGCIATKNGSNLLCRGNQHFELCIGTMNHDFVPLLLSTLRLRVRSLQPSQREALFTTWFMETPLSLFRMHWDHEPVRTRSSRRESAQTSPTKDVRTHVRCYRVHGKPPRLLCRTLGPGTGQ